MARRELSAAQKAELDQKRQERVSQLQEELAKGIESMMSGAGWAEWLEMARRFPQYSLRNQVLILRQNPKATQVAGYHAWQAMGRQVRRGERAIAVMAPIARTVTDDETAALRESEDRGASRCRVQAQLGVRHQPNRWATLARFGTCRAASG